MNEYIIQLDDTHRIVARFYKMSRTRNSTILYKEKRDGDKWVVYNIERDNDLNEIELSTDEQLNNFIKGIVRLEKLMVLK